MQQVPWYKDTMSFQSVADVFEFLLDNALHGPVETIVKNVGICDLNAPMPEDEQTRLLHKFINFEGRTTFAIESFNRFSVIRLPQLIEDAEIVLMGNVIKFENVYIMKPSMNVKGENVPLLPDTARHQERTYAATVYADVVRYSTAGGRRNRMETEEGVRLFDIPIMLGSHFCHLAGMPAKELRKARECPSDPFGYFVIKGSERFILLDEKLRAHRPFIHAGKKPDDIVCKTTCLTPMGSTVVTLSVDAAKAILIQVRSLELPVDVFSFIYSIYEFMDREISEREIMDNILKYVHKDDVNVVQSGLLVTIASFRTGNPIQKVTSSFQRRAAKMKQVISDTDLADAASVDTAIITLVGDLYSHMEWDPRDPETLYGKLETLYFAIAKYAQYLTGVRPPDDRDAWGNKRLETPGRLMENLFISYWRGYVAKAEEALRKSAGTLLNMRTITNEINKQFDELSVLLAKAFSPNSWGNKDHKNYREGVTDLIKRESILNLYSQLTKVNAHASRQSKNMEIRLVQMSQIGYVDVIETQEGESVGINKHLAVGCYLSLSSDPSYVMEIAIPYLSAQKTEVHQHPFAVNGRIMGFCNAFDLHPILVSARRSLTIPRDVCIVIDHTSLPVLSVFTDGARPCRPLLVVNTKTGRLVLDEVAEVNPNVRNLPFEELLRLGVVEFIDALEHEWIRLADSVKKVRERKLEEMEIVQELVDTDDRKEITRRRALDVYRRLHPTSSYSHCEIDPSAVLGYAASIIPFPQHSQAPRNVYQTGMGKQALGTYHSNMRYRFETTAKTLAYAELPVVSTPFNKELAMEEMPSGQMVTLAVMSYYGWNQEDSIIMNQRSVDMGKFRIRVTKSFRIVLESDRDFKQRFMNPARAEGIKMNPEEIRFQHILDNGKPMLGAFLKAGDAIIGRVQINNATGEVSNRSEYLGIGVNGTVSEVLQTVNAAQQQVMIVKIYEDRKPVVGDKFALRNAQKGTVGKILPYEDMPFTETGMTPDIIINPHSLPSRMTINMLLEMIFGKVAVQRGSRINAAVFRENSLDAVEDALKFYGLNPSGTEVMYNGVRGTQLQQEVYIGPAYYQALRHHPKDKFQVRGTGRRTITYNQPVQGRKHGGGIRFGEMERDALIGHGASWFINDRLFRSSDAYQYPRCSQCGRVAQVRVSEGETTCKCGGALVRMHHSFVYKYAEHLLSVAGIKMTSVIEEEKPVVHEDIETLPKNIFDRGQRRRDDEDEDAGEEEEEVEETYDEEENDEFA